MRNSGTCHAVVMCAHDVRAEAQPSNPLPPDEQVDIAVDVLRMLADPTRLRMLWLLCRNDYDVTSLATAVGIARPAVSQHLAKLRLAGLVSTRRAGRRAVYHAKGRHVRRLVTEAFDAAQHRVGGPSEPD